MVGGACRALPARLFARPASCLSPPVIPSVRICTPGGSLQPPLWSAQAGRLLILGLREVGVWNESMWWWGCAPISSRAPAAPASLPSLLALLSPLPRVLFSLSIRLAISPLPVSSIPPRPLQAIRLARKWSPYWSWQGPPEFSLAWWLLVAGSRGWAWLVPCAGRWWWIWSRREVAVQARLTGVFFGIVGEASCRR